MVFYFIVAVVVFLALISFLLVDKPLYGDLTIYDESYDGVYTLRSAVDVGYSLFVTLVVSLLWVIAFPVGVIVGLAKLYIKFKNKGK